MVTGHPELPNLSKVLPKHLPLLYILEKIKLSGTKPTLSGTLTALQFKSSLVRAILKPPQQLYGRPQDLNASPGIQNWDQALWSSD